MIGRPADALRLGGWDFQSKEQKQPPTKPKRAAELHQFRAEAFKNS